jgi:hypothetical protein
MNGKVVSERCRQLLSPSRQRRQSGGILQRLRGHHWTGVAFVRSTKIILARCMKEKGVPAETANQLLAAIGDTSDPLQTGRETAKNLCRSRFAVLPASASLSEPNESLTLGSSLAA